MDTGRILAAVRDYKRHWRDRARDELQSFERESFRNAVERAGLARQPESKNGRKYRHQGSIPGARTGGRQGAPRDPGLGAVGSFDELHERVKAAIGGISGIGELTIYDTAPSASGPTWGSSRPRWLPAGRLRRVRPGETNTRLVVSDQEKRTRG